MSRPRNIRAALAEADLESVLRQLLFSGNLVAVGNLSWRTTHEALEAIVRGLKISESLPQGIARPPLDDFFVLRVVGGELNPNQVIDQIQPRRSQTVIVLLLDGKDHSRWVGAVYRDGDVSPLAGFRIVGGEMIEVGLATEEVLDTDERYSRLIGAVGEEVFQRLRRAQVTLVGVSRNGTLMAWHLAALGIRQLRLVDMADKASHHYDVMIGVDADTNHGKKVFAVAEALLRYRSDIGISCCEHSVLDPAAHAIFDRPTDLFVTCTDNLSSRVAVSIQARRLLVPHLDIGTSVQRDESGARRIFGDARLFLPSTGCCYCTPPLSPKDREQVFYELSAPADTLRRGEPTEWSAQRAGSLITINTMTVATGTQMWLDLLAGDLRTSFWQRIDWHPVQGLETHSSAVGPADDCPFCQG